MKPIISFWIYIIQSNIFSASVHQGSLFILCRDKIYIAPSGVQKERIMPEDLFVQDLEGNDIEVPIKKLKKSQCTPLFMCAYTG